MICTYNGCEDEARFILAVPFTVANAVMVNPYCEEHREAVMELGAVYALGDALSEDAKPISGVHE